VVAGAAGVAMAIGVRLSWCARWSAIWSVVVCYSKGAMCWMVTHWSADGDDDNS
jgi:hypothetical protein